jgi:predicted ribonuclease YlaK
MNFEKYYLLDTNILLEDARNIFKLSDGAKNLIILSETVLDELDSKKSGYDEINFQAREFARILENSEVLSSNKYEDFKIIRLKLINQDETILDESYTPLEDSEVSSRVEQMISNYGIETMWVGEMRGRTLSNSFIIIDEAQNMSNKTMQMVLSRVDSSCKVVILGSNKQIDNFYVNRYTNALTTLLKSTQNENNLVNIFAIKLEKVLRGPITEWAEN